MLSPFAEMEDDRMLQLRREKGKPPARRLRAA